MSKNIRKLVASAMQELGIEYGFLTYFKEPIVYPYFVGQYTESAPMSEDGMQESRFSLYGYTRGSWEELEEKKEQIEAFFNKVSGKTVIVENGSAVAVFYESALTIPTGNAELKRIQINLICKEWSVN